MLTEIGCKLTCMNTLADRIKEAMREARVDAKELAGACGVQPQAVYQWRSGATKSLEGMNLVKAAARLGVRGAWLGEGRGPKHVTDTNVQLVELPRAMDVPLISWVQAGAWGEIVDNFAPGDAEEWMICPRRHGVHAFALRVRGVSMRPKYEDGDIIFVDPDASADHGKNVIVRLENEKEATFKQLVIEDGRKFLRALNPEWTPRIMEINERATICGVVIGKWVPE